MKSALRYLLCENTIIYPCFGSYGVLFCRADKFRKRGATAEEYETKTALYVKTRNVALAKMYKHIYVCIKIKTKTLNILLLPIC